MKTGFLALLSVLICCLSSSIVTAEDGMTFGDLCFDFDINMDSSFDSKDRELKEKEPFVLGTNNSDVDKDGRVDWHNTSVEDFDNLRKCILRRFSLPSTNHSLWLTSQSVPIKDETTGIERIGQIRLFDSKGNELLPPGERSSRQMPPALVASLAERDLLLYVEGVLGHDARVGVEVRAGDGEVVKADYQRITMIGPTAVKITRDANLTPYETLKYFRSTTVIDDFTVANQLLENAVKRDTWGKSDIKTKPDIPPEAAALINDYVSRKNFIIVGGDSGKLNTLKQLQYYVSGIIENCERYREQAQQDPAVLPHLLILIQYFADNKDEPLRYRNMLKLCALAEELGERSISAADATIIADLTLACQDALAFIEPQTEEEALLFNRWKASLTQRIRDDQKPIHTIAKQLEDNSYKKRRQAELTLREMGDKARPVLEEYLLHDDPEIRMAVERLLRSR